MFSVPDHLENTLHRGHNSTRRTRLQLCRCATCNRNCTYTKLCIINRISRLDSTLLVFIIIHTTYFIMALKSCYCMSFGNPNQSWPIRSECIDTPNKDKCRAVPSFLQKGGSKPKILDLSANSTQQSCVNEVSPNWMGSRAHLKALEALGFFITKYAFCPFWGTFLYYF